MIPTFIRGLPASGTLGVAANTITRAFDATSCDFILFGMAYGGQSPGDVTTLSITTATYAGVNLTPIFNFTVVNGSNTGGAALYYISNPTQGSNNVIFTMSGSAGGITEGLPIVCLGYRYVTGIGNTASSNTGTAGTNLSFNLTVGKGNLGVAVGSHGSSITGAGGNNKNRVLNNYNTSFANGCLDAVEREGAFNTSAIAMNINSAVSDWWLAFAVELIGTPDGQPPFFPVQDYRRDWRFQQLFGNDGIVLANGTPTPATRDLPFTDVAPTVSAGATVSPTVDNFLITDVAPTISAGATVNPAVDNLPITDIAPTVSAGATVSPAVDNLPITDVAPTISAGAIVSPSVDNLPFTDIAPTISAGATVNPTTRDMPFNKFAPTIFTGGTGATPSPSTDDLPFADIAPTISAGATVVLTTRNMFITDILTTPSAGATVSPSVDNLPITDFSPGISAGATVNPVTDDLPITDNTPTIFTGSPSTPTRVGRTRKKRRS